MTVGQRIQQVRKAAGLSQRELGEKLGVSGSMIGQYENDLRNPKYETLQRIAVALNVSVEELYGITDTLKAAIEDEVMDIVHLSTGNRRSKDEIFKILMHQEIELIPTKDYLNSIKEADDAVVERFKDISDRFIKDNLLAAYNYLNRRGRIEALLRIEEIYENPRFHDEYCADDFSTAEEEQKSQAEAQDGESVSESDTE